MTLLWLIMGVAFLFFEMPWAVAFCVFMAVYEWFKKGQP